jgi:uncharacterized protein
MRKLFAGVVLGGALALTGSAVWEAGRYVSGAPGPSAKVESKPLLPFEVDPTWVLSGQPHFRASETRRSPDGRVVSGLWACDGPSTFQWRFGLDETVHLLEGRVEVSYQGREFVLMPGDTATFHAGTDAIWHVPQHAKKAYALHYPGRLVRWWRDWFAPT